MLVIPLSPTPSQVVNVLLAGQDVKLNVYQKSTGLFVDVFVAGVALKVAQIARDRVVLVRHEYLGFLGDLFFKDLQGLADPDYTGLGGRFVLGYQSTL